MPDIPVALRGYRQQARAARRSGYPEGVLGAAAVVAAGDVPAPAVIDVVNRQIVSVLGVDSSRFVPGELPDPRLALLDHEGIVSRRGPLRHLSAARIAYPSLEQRRVAVLLADQAAPVLAAP